MGITEKIHKTTELTNFKGQIPTNYLYTYGIAGEDFFRKIKDEGKFTASKCKECGVTYLPARIFCERCMGRLSETIEVKPEGQLYSFTVCWENMDGSRKDKPDILGAVKIDGTDGVLVHYLGGIEPEEIEIGMQVEAVLKPKKDREGSIFDIKHFKPSA